MRIYIEDLTFDAIIGILPKERITPQRVIINVELDYDYKKNVFINYADAAKIIENDIKKSKYRLIEDALLSLNSVLKDNFTQISSIKLKISKPTILDHCGVSVESKIDY